jgi:hypothetical protein
LAFLDCQLHQLQVWDIWSEKETRELTNGCLLVLSQSSFLHLHLFFIYNVQLYRNKVKYLYFNFSEAQNLKPVFKNQKVYEENIVFLYPLSFSIFFSTKLSVLVALSLSFHSFYKLT